jgi:hypothetical protein
MANRQKGGNKMKKKDWFPDYGDPFANMKRKGDVSDDIKKFTQMGHFDVYIRQGKVASIGLHWGESKRLAGLGIPRKKQIKMLNWLEMHPKEAKELLRY